MTHKKNPRLRILRREKQKLDVRIKEVSNDKELQPGDILVYSPIVLDPIHVDENSGKMYLCLGEASSKELGKLGDALSNTFSSIKIVAVLEEGGEVDYFLEDELKLVRKKNE
jgi:hypothetical protein